ncbi:MAG TPA: Rieske (2Fe-2S) protein [Vicinamibacterales bacterium]|nr:Rieske (2Fe-2S) protein [Vicinamibacterales bacterium]
MHNRREFCQGLILISIATAIEACGGGSSTAPSSLPSIATINGSASGNQIQLTVDGSSSLAAVGSAARVQTSAGSVLVARTAQSTFSALTAICTHEGCTVDEFQGGTYECSCHGSQFSTSGAVVRGPAGSPLRSFATSYAAPNLTITIA